MSEGEKELRIFLQYWNKQDIDACAARITDDIELHSSYALKIFPESNGILVGKEMVLEYIKLMFNGFINIDVANPKISKVDDYYIVKAANDTDTLNYYLRYYLNDKHQIYLVKSNLTQKIP